MAEQIELHEAPFGLTSACWRHFKLTTDKNTAVCNYCSFKIKYSQGNTSNLISHLKRKHKEIEIGISRYGKKNVKSERSTNVTKITQSLFPQELKASSPKAQAINRAITKFIAKDLR